MGGVTSVLATFYLTHSNSVHAMLQYSCGDDVLEFIVREGHRFSVLVRSVVGTQLGASTSLVHYLWLTTPGMPALCQEHMLVLPSPIAGLVPYAGPTVVSALTVALAAYHGRVYFQLSRQVRRGSGTVKSGRTAW